MQNYTEIDLGKMFLVLLRKWWLLLISVVVGGGAAFLITYYAITPLYRASVTIYVNNTNSSAQSSDAITTSNLSAAQQLVNTYVTIINSNTVLNHVIEVGALDCTAEDIRKMMTASAVNNTEVFAVYITHPEPEMAAKIANTIADVAPDEIATFLEGSSAKIIDYAVVPETKYSPSYFKNTAVGALLVFMLCAAGLILAELFDVRIKSEDDVRQLCELPVLGAIPSFHQRRTGEYGYVQKTLKKGETEVA